MFRKNTAGQFICVQLILAASGAKATGLSPAARRCIDGTFGDGGGSFTEDGTTGSYKYALAQADTNGNNISIIVTATGAIPVCINFITTAADPTDSVRLGLTGLANAVPGAAGGLFIAGTNAATTITTALTTTFTGNLTGSVGSVTNGVTLAAGQKVDVDTIKTNPVVNGGTVTFPTNETLASTTNITAGTIATVTNLTNLPSIPTNWITATGISASALNGKGDWNIGKTGYSLTQAFPPNFSALDIGVTGHVVNVDTVGTLTGYAAAPTANENADALLDRTAGVETNRTLRQALRIILAVLSGKLSGANTTQITIRDTNDSKNRVIATVDSDGNRTALTLDAS